MVRRKEMILKVRMEKETEKRLGRKLGSGQWGKKITFLQGHPFCTKDSSLQQRKVRVLMT